MLGQEAVERARQVGDDVLLGQSLSSTFAEGHHELGRLTTVGATTSGSVAGSPLTGRTRTNVLCPSAILRSICLVAFR